MKDEVNTQFILHRSELILHPSSFILTVCRAAAVRRMLVA
jgi:hypothetical protein